MEAWRSCQHVRVKFFSVGTAVIIRKLFLQQTPELIISDPSAAPAYHQEVHSVGHLRALRHKQTVCAHDPGQDIRFLIRQFTVDDRNIIFPVLPAEFRLVMPFGIRADPVPPGQIITSQLKCSDVQRSG